MVVEPPCKSTLEVWNCVPANCAGFNPGTLEISSPSKLASMSRNASVRGFVDVLEDVGAGVGEATAGVHIPIATVQIAVIAHARLESLIGPHPNLSNSNNSTGWYPWQSRSRHKSDCGPLDDTSLWLRQGREGYPVGSKIIDLLVTPGLTRLATTSRPTPRSKAPSPMFERPLSGVRLDQDLRPPRLHDRRLQPRPHSRSQGQAGKDEAKPSGGPDAVKELGVIASPGTAKPFPPRPQGRRAN